MNQYHEAFLAWSFRKCLEGVAVAPPIVQTERVSIELLGFISKSPNLV